MDQYIKKKSKPHTPIIQKNAKSENQTAIITRQLRQQIGQIFQKLGEFERRCEQIKSKLQQIEIDSYIVNDKDNVVLVKSSLPQSSIKNSVPNRQAQEANKEFQQNTKLEIVENMADKLNSNSAVIRQTDVTAQKLQESGDRTLKSRKIRKKF